MERQVKERISALRDFLAGRSGEPKVAEAGDKATRQVVAEELLAVMSRTATDATEEPSGCAQDVSAGDVEAMALSDSEGISLEQRQPKPGDQEEQERARQLFIDQGYFDEAVQDLRGANSPQERAAAARVLGLVGSKRGTAHLIAAMFDDDPEVRNAAEEALAQMGGRAASNVPGNARLSGEPDSEKLRVVEAFPSAQRPSVSEAPSQESDEPDQRARDAVGASNENEALSPKSPEHDHSARVPSMIETAPEKSGVDESEIRVQSSAGNSTNGSTRE